MNTILTILGILGGVAAVVMTVMSAISFRKPRKITALSTFLSGFISLLSLVAMTLLGGMSLNFDLGVLLLVIGLFLGFLRGSAVKMSWENNLVIGRNSILFLILWGFSLALSQLLGLLGSPLLASLGLIHVVFTTGLQIGLFGHLFLRRLIMGRKGKTSKGLQVVVGIGGGIGLFLLMMFAFLMAGSVVLDGIAILEDWPQARSFQEESTPANTGTNSTESGNSAGTSSQDADQESGGPLQINCADQVERIKEHSLNAYNISGANASFEEAFVDYQISLEMALDLESGEFVFDHQQLESWSWYGFDREYYESNPGPIRNYQDDYLGNGTLLDNGWISGEFAYNSTSWSDQDDLETKQDSNLFVGFISDAQESVSICLLPVGVNRNPETETMDLEKVISAGKEQLVPGWWNASSCYICTVE